MSERADYISDRPVYVEPSGKRLETPLDKAELPEPDEQTVMIAIRGLERVAALNPIVNIDRQLETWFGGDRRMSPPKIR